MKVSGVWRFKPFNKKKPDAFWGYSFDITIGDDIEHDFDAAARMNVTLRDFYSSLPDEWFQECMDQYESVLEKK